MIFSLSISCLLRKDLALGKMQFMESILEDEVKEDIVGDNKEEN